MKAIRWLAWLAAGAAVGSLMSSAEAAQPGLYEMRVYYAPEGKLDQLHARFRDHTLTLFAKHGMKNVGYFVPEGDNPERKLVYFLAYPDRAARDTAWKAFQADPEWQAARAASEKEGSLVARVVETFLAPTDYSPVPQVEQHGGRVFELRTYTATAGNLAALDARFRDHTMGLFAKHGMTNLVYWHLAPGSPQADRMLIYLLSHANREAARKSFAAFLGDPDWTTARTDSERRADGSLTEPKGGVLSEFLVPTDYSPWK